MTPVQRPITFHNGTNRLAGVLHLPRGFDEQARHAAVVIATPGSSVKEQIGANYATRLAAAGLVALVFDPSNQGASEGEPRDLENPWIRAEDVRCAVDMLVTLPFVDEGRIGLLGVCAGGGYAVQAAMTDHRIRALGTVVGGDIGGAFRRMQGPEGIRATLEKVGRHRTAEARGESEVREPWIPDSLEEARAAGITDPELLEAVWFYRESPYRHPRSTNRLYQPSQAYILGFDAFHLVPELLAQPLLVIVGGRRGATGQFEDGERLFGLTSSPHKAFHVIEGAGHYDMYHVPGYLDEAVGRLAPFFEARLGAD